METGDLNVDAVGETETQDGEQAEKIPSAKDKFDYDIALLFSGHLKDEDLAEKVQKEMIQVKLDDSRRLRVCLYNDPTFGGSIVERPRNVVCRCRFILVMVTEHIRKDSHTTFTKNESIGHILAAEPPERRHCVRPLFLQQSDIGKYSIPDGLTDVDPVLWDDSQKALCQKKLAKLIFYEKYYGSNMNVKKTDQIPSNKGDDLDTDATAERLGATGPSSAESHPNMADNGRGDFAQGHSQSKTGPGSDQPTADIAFEDEKGCMYRVKVKGQMQGLMVGHHQTMNITEYSKTKKTKSVKKNKLPVTTSTAIPPRKAMDLVSEQIGKEWKKLGRELGISDDELHTVRVDHHIEGQEEVVYQMLRKWNTNAYPTTLAQLAQACVNIGRGDIADNLATLAQDPKK